VAHKFLENLWTPAVRWLWWWTRRDVEVVMACCSSMEHLINIGAAQTTLQRGVTLIYLCSIPTHISASTIQLQYY